MKDKKSRAKLAMNYLFYKGVAKTQKDLSTLLGYDESYFSQVMTGKTKALSNKLLERMANLDPDLNLNWLISGEGSMLNSETDGKYTLLGNDKVEQEMVDQLRATIKRLEEQVQNSQEQVNKLLSIVEKLTNWKDS